MLTNFVLRREEICVSSFQRSSRNGVEEPFFLKKKKKFYGKKFIGDRELGCKIFL